MKRALLLLLLPLAVACEYTIDDGQWTYEWRTHGEVLHDARLRQRLSCGQGAVGERLLGHLRASRLRTCATHCASRSDAEKESCTLHCDAGMQLASAHCEPRTHTERVGFGGPR